MNINRNEATHILPYKVVLLDATDAYYYADVMDNMEEFATIENFNVAKDLADALFVIKNYKWESLEAMNELDAGFDVRVYDSKFSCVYAAHESFEKIWIGSRRKVIDPDETLELAGKLIKKALDESKAKGSV
ncbi:hypothetical protein M1307_02205 [Patescibacteria group bacterium]|nr:hypothetical protein [Patescibacteria group bacterium]